MKAELESTSAFFKRSVERSTAKGVAGASHLLHGHIAWLYEQMDPRTCDDDLLEPLHGAPVGVFKKPAQAWKGTGTAPGVDGTPIAAGTVFQRDDERTYTVDADASVVSGVATLNLTATELGAGPSNDNGAVINVSSPIAGLDGSCTIASTTQAGLDIESRKDYQLRVEKHKQAPFRGGAPGDYANWALEVVGITRAWDYGLTPSIGQVTVYVVNDNDGIVVDGTKLDEVTAYVTARMPSTVGALHVLTPTLAPLDPTIHPVPDTPEIRTAIAASLTSYLTSVGDTGGITIPRSQLVEAIVNTPGLVDHDLVSPAADVDVPFGSLPALGTITWV